MGYYRGDYYRGDYYRGDFLGSLGRLATGLVKRVVPGAQLASDIAGVFKRRQVVPSGGGQAPRVDLPGPWNPRIPTFRDPDPTISASAVMCCPQGGHTNKSTYITRGGGTSRWPQQILVHEKGTECVKPRRMNVGNIRALMRGLRRARGFEKIARRVLRITPHFKKSKGGFGGGRRKKKCA